MSTVKTLPNVRHSCGGVIHTTAFAVESTVKLGCGCTNNRGRRCDGSRMEVLTPVVCDRHQASEGAGQVELDLTSSASSQHYIDTGEHLPVPAHKWGDQIKVGDVLLIIGSTHNVTSITPYGPSNLDFVDDRWRVMHSGDFRMTLDPDAGWVQDENGAWKISHRLRARPAKASV